MYAAEQPILNFNFTAVRKLGQHRIHSGVGSTYGGILPPLMRYLKHAFQTAGTKLGLPVANHQKSGHGTISSEVNFATSLSASSRSRQA